MQCCRLHKNFKEFEQIKPGFAIEEIYGGALLGLRSQDFVCFYDWTTAQVCHVLPSPLQFAMLKDGLWAPHCPTIAVLSSMHGRLYQSEDACFAYSHKSSHMICA